MPRINDQEEYPIKLAPNNNDTIIGNDWENEGKTVSFRLGSLLAQTGTEGEFVPKGGYTGSGQDLYNSIPTHTSDLTNNGAGGSSMYVEADELSTVATSGNYNDLTSKPVIPTIPTNTSSFVNDGADGTSTYVQELDLSPVATSGDYSDLINTPAIPTIPTNTSSFVNDGADGVNPYITLGDVVQPIFTSQLINDGDDSTSTYIEFDDLPTTLKTVGGESIIGSGDVDLSFKTTISAGAVSGFTLSDNGDGTVDLSSGIAYLRATNDPYADIMQYSIGATTNLVLQDNANNYVLVDYNGGSPAITVTTNPSTINTQTNSLACVIARVGTDLEYISLVGQNVDPNAKIRIRFLNQEGIRRASGAVLGFSNRNLTLTSSVLFSGLIRLNGAAFNTAISDTFTQVYNNGSVWTRTVGQTQVNNTQYNASGTLTTMPNNTFRTDYVYLLPNNPSKLYVVMGTQTYGTVDLAKTAPKPTSLPVELQVLGLLVGRFFIGKNSASVAEVQSSFEEEFDGASLSDHNSLSGLQGGAADQRNHLDNAQVALVNSSEQTSNKATNFATVNNILYPSVQAVKDELDLKHPLENQRVSTTDDIIFNSANITNSASINNLSVGVNPVHSDGTIVVRKGVTGEYGTASQETLQDIIGIGGDFASNPSLLLFQGDSMTAGVPPADPYPDSIVAANVFDKVNNAVGSKTIATIRTEASTLDDVLYRFSARENIYVLWAGTNDLYNTYDVATTFKNLEATCRERQKKGFKVIVLTTLPRCGFAADGITTMESLILDYNTLIRQRWSTFADNIADVASDVTINSVNPCIDTTYYNGDGIHLTNAGNALLLPYVQNAINELSTQTTFQDVNIKGNIVQPVTIKKAFGTSETALTINNTSELNGNLGAIDFKARNSGFGDNGLTSRIESISNGASIGQTVLNIKVAENAVSLNTILSMDGVSKNSTFSGAVSATSYTGGATLTETPTAPTAAVGTNTTQIATMAAVANALAGTTGYLLKKAGTGETENSSIYESGGFVTVDSDSQFQGSVQFNDVVSFGNIAVLKGYTVALLPTGLITGSMAYVTDALTPTSGATIVGGGSVTCPVFYDGTNWVRF